MIYEWKFFAFFPEQPITTLEYKSLMLLSNIVREHPGVFLASVARHICCGTFMFFGMVASIGCISHMERYELVLMVGAGLFSAGFIITCQESRATENLHAQSGARIHQYRSRCKSHYERLEAMSFSPMNCQLGWIMYTFDQLTFLEFMHFLFDKVLMFILLYC